MRFKIEVNWQTLTRFFATFLVSMPTWGQETTSWEGPASWFVYAVIFIVLIGSLLVLLFVRAALYTSSWSLADALSEAVQITAVDKDAKGNAELITVGSDSDKTLIITEMRASSSRMIAMMGMIIIMLMFLGFGAFALFNFAKTGQMPGDIDDVVKFLLSGLTLFAPYAVNKFSSIFESLSPKKT